MIESYYWKEELLRIGKCLRRVHAPPRSSERAYCVVERDIMIGFFMLRRLIELRKVSNLTQNARLSVFYYKSTGKHVHKMNNHRIEELYQMQHEVSVQTTPGDIANQFIHAYTSFIVRDESRNWSDILIVSDFDRNERIWRIPISEIERIFRIAAKDHPHTAELVFNPKKGDYDIKTN